MSPNLSPICTLNPTPDHDCLLNCTPEEGDDHESDAEHEPDDCRVGVEGDCEAVGAVGVEPDVAQQRLLEADAAHAELQRQR